MAPSCESTRVESWRRLEGLSTIPRWKITKKSEAAGRPCTYFDSFCRLILCIRLIPPEWLQSVTPRHLNAPADYWSQKVLAVSSVNAAMQNYISIHEHQIRPTPALAAVHGQATPSWVTCSLLLRVSEKYSPGQWRQHLVMNRVIWFSRKT